MTSKRKVPQVVDSLEDSGLIIRPRPRVRHPFDRDACLSKMGGESKTQQSAKESCCINRIMNSVGRTGAIPVDPRGRVPHYGDVSHLNRPYAEMLQESMDTQKQLVKFTEEQREKIRLANIERRKKLHEDAKAYRAHLATVGKTNTTPGDATQSSTVGASPKPG